MNKTVNINLAGIFFHIDEDAFLKLERYLEAIKRSFTDSQGRSEIIADIEARIAELFAERIQNEKQVVNTKLVDEVITIMGQPEDYLVDDEIFEDEPQQKKTYSTKSTKKLFRDTDNSYIGGVASGLSHYLGIDSIWVRLLWLLLTLGSGGTFIVIYLIFWALVPEAKTTAEKLTMTGDPVNISNIEKKIKDGIDTVSETVKNVDFKKHGEKLKEGFDNVADNISETVKGVDFQKQGNRLKSSSQNFFDSIGSILMFFLKIVAKFIGIILIIVGISMLITLIVAFFSVGITNAVNIPFFDFVNVANLANVPMWLMSLLLFFAIGIPFFFLFYLGLKILVNNLKSIGNVAKFTLLGLWIMAIIGLFITGVRQVSERAFDAKIINKEVLNISATDTLTVKMNSNDSFYENYTYGRNHYKTFTTDENGKQLISNNVTLIVRSTKEDNAYIIIEKEASGSNYTIAEERAKNINYMYNLKEKTLLLDDFLSTNIENKLSQQHVIILLYLPEGTTLFADHNTYHYHRNPSYYNDILDNGMEEHYLKIGNGKIECLDCDDDIDSEVNEEENNNETENNAEVAQENNQTSNTEEQPDVSIEINEEDGVNIKINDN